MELLSRTGWRLAVGITVASMAIGIPASALAVPGAPGHPGGGDSGAGWSIQRSPNPAGAHFSELNAVSCPSKAACTAVGYYNRSTGPTLTLAEAWNGTRWKIQRSPSRAGASGSVLQAVSCPSATACSAVGYYYNRAGTRFAMAEARNGSKWRRQAIPSPHGATDTWLYAVSCTSSAECTAGGAYISRAGTTVALAERWNGRSWRIQRTPRPAKITQFGAFFGVSCTSPRACTAAGYYNTGTGDAQPLVEAWNGMGWRVQKALPPTGTPGGAFSAVSCTSPRACTATGTSFGTTGGTLAERWNGKRWKAQATPDPPNYTTSFSSITLPGASCSSARACAAVGGYTPGGQPATFAESWDGTSWSLQTTPSAAGTVSNILNGVSCTPAQCIAVGAANTTSGLIVTVAIVSASG